MLLLTQHIVLHLTYYNMLGYVIFIIAVSLAVLALTERIVLHLT
jgi:hypothetical protein